MKHIATEEKHTLVLNENEWHGLKFIMDGYNEAFKGLEFDNEDIQQTNKRLCKLFNIECLTVAYSDDEW